MSCLQAQNVSFGFPDRLLLESVSFLIEPGDRVGLIGANGTGKTTLFKLIRAELTPDEGALVLGRDIKLGYTEQYYRTDDLSVYEEALSVFNDVVCMEEELSSIHDRLMEMPGDLVLIERQSFLTDEIQRRDGLVYRAKTRSALLGLGFSEEDLNKNAGLLSGGERSKLALCKLLLSDCGLILLDEPTNHLDIDAISWLEDFLLKVRGAVIIISHDRFFLDRTTSKTIELSNHKAYVTNVPYTRHKALMEERKLALKREYEKGTKEIERIEGIIEQQRRFNRDRNYVTIASKEKQIERIRSQIVSPDKEAKEIRFSFKTDAESGEEVLSLAGIGKAFDGKTLFSGVNFELRKGEKVFILGPNGCGKSTLLKLITRELMPDTGIIRLGYGVRVGYFDQTISKLNDTNTVLEEVWGSRRLEITDVRRALSSFLFSGDDVQKKVGSLSGGERARVQILKLMLRRPNFLILDEPTNHLDISSREVLEDALLDFDGTVLAVSHDRYLINKLAEKIVVLEKDGITVIDGNYDSYLDYKNTSASKSVTPSEEEKKSDYRLRKERESELRRKKGKIERLEARIAADESALNALENDLNLPENAADYENTALLCAQINEKKEEIEALYTEWEDLNA